MSPGGQNLPWLRSTGVEGVPIPGSSEVKWGLAPGSQVGESEVPQLRTGPGEAAGPDHVRLPVPTALHSALVAHLPAGLLQAPRWGMGGLLE